MSVAGYCVHCEVPAGKILLKTGCKLYRLGMSAIAVFSVYPVCSYLNRYPAALIFHVYILCRTLRSPEFVCVEKHCDCAVLYPCVQHRHVVKNGFYLLRSGICSYVCIRYDLPWTFFSAPARSHFPVCCLSHLLSYGFSDTATHEIPFESGFLETPQYLCLSFFR